jgi:ketosteroid isomerase-like protein
MADDRSTSTPIAERIRNAFESADPAAIGDLLSPDVRWGAPDDPQPGCTNREQVLAWYQRGRDAGVRAQVTEVVVHGDDKVLVGLHVTGRVVPGRSDGEADRWQVLTLRAGRVVDIRGFDDRDEAAARAMGRVGKPTRNEHGVMTIPTDDPVAVAAVAAIHSGDVPALKRLLADHPGLATACLGDGGMARSLLHVVTDWPGHYPNGADTVVALVTAGAHVNARFVGPHKETPLHWAASSDDVAVLDALLDAGADIEASGAVIGGGTPIADATAFGQWNAAHRLLERGARTGLWEAAALGLIDRVERYYEGTEQTTPDDTTHAFWCACHGGQERIAEYLLDHGADINWIGYDQLTPLEAAQRSEADSLVAWLRQRGAKSADQLP